MPRKIPTSEWLENKFKRILEMTKIVTKQNQGKITEPEYGFWSLKKEIALMYWIWPFLQIASQHFTSFYYIDLFAGSGLMKTGPHNFFVGSPLVAVCSTLPDKKFKQYICFEIDKSRKNALEKRASIAADHFETCCPKVFNVDCNKELERVLKEFCPSERSCFLAFVDPQRINDLKWRTLHTLLIHGKGDIILNFPTSGIIRNLSIAQSKKALTGFFGDNNWCKINPNADDLINYYMKKITCVDGYERTVDNLSVMDGSNHRLYDLIFATGSVGMKNVMLHLKSRLEKIKTEDFRVIQQVLAGPQTQLTGFQ